MPETGTALKTENPVGESSPNWEHVLGLQCELTIEVPLPGFKVADLAHLEPKMIIGSRWHVGEDVPLRVNGQLIAWSEFEVVGNRLAVRITELR